MSPPTAPWTPAWVSAGKWDRLPRHPPRAPGSWTSSSHLGVFSGVVGSGETEAHAPSPGCRVPPPLCGCTSSLGLGSNTSLTISLTPPAPLLGSRGHPDEDGVPAAQLLGRHPAGGCGGAGGTLSVRTPTCALSCCHQRGPARISAVDPACTHTGYRGQGHAIGAHTSHHTPPPCVHTTQGVTHPCMHTTGVLWAPFPTHTTHMRARHTHVTPHTHHTQHTHTTHHTHHTHTTHHTHMYHAHTSHTSYTHHT